MTYPAAITEERAETGVRRAVFGWITFDFAAITWSTTMLTVTFPLWVVDDAGGSDGRYGTVVGLSMAMSLLIAPLLGGSLDRIARRMPIMIATTLVTVALTMGIGAGSLNTALLLFFIANAVFQAGFLVYESLLPHVAEPHERGRLSGAGVAAGFGGSLVAVLLAAAALTLGGGDRPLAMRLAALVFLIGAVPCFLWVRERPRDEAVPVERISMRAQARESIALVREVPAMRRFLTARMLYADAGNTLVAFIGIYGKKELGFSDLAVQGLLLAGILGGAVGAILFGRAADTRGPLTAVSRTIMLWLAVFAAVAFIPILGLPSVLFWAVAPVCGICIGATPAADRAALFQLAPEEATGRAIGLYNMVGRAGLVTGPLVWAFIVGTLGFSRPIAVIALGLLMVCALVVIRPLAADEQRTTTA